MTQYQRDTEYEFIDKPWVKDALRKEFPDNYQDYIVVQADVGYYVYSSANEMDSYFLLEKATPNGHAFYLNTQAAYRRSDNVCYVAKDYFKEPRTIIPFEDALFYYYDELYEMVGFDWDKTETLFKHLDDGQLPREVLKQLKLP